MRCPAIHDRATTAMQLHDLPEGVLVRPLVRHADNRGDLAELYRAEWTPSGPFLQWNLVRSEGGVLRGVHVHPRHCDYLLVLSGAMLLGLHDFRPDDPALRRSAMLTLVCHGFWLEGPTTYVYGLSTGWDPAEELGCRYDDPALGLTWPVMAPVLSAKDAVPPHDYASMRAAWFAMRAKADAQ
jgi:dTDP-4-dehydrorhamnose 3,5-epimerase